MAETPKDIKGPIVVSARIVAKPGKADELAQHLANLKAYANSDAEPGTLVYEIVRSGDEFAVWEKYADLAAFVAHSSNELVLKGQKLDSFEIKDKGIFFSADSLPPPSKL